MIEDLQANDARDSARGSKAAAELELLEEAFAKLEAAAIEEWKQTPIGQIDKREKLYLVVNTSQAVKRALLKIVQAGEIARIALAGENLLRP